MSVADNEAYSVLFVDRDEDTLPIYEDVLGSEESLEVDTAESLEEVDESDYSLVVTEYLGEETEEFYDEDEDVLLFTAYDREILGFPDESDYLQKGISKDELIEEIEARI